MLAETTISLHFFSCKCVSTIEKDIHLKTPDYRNCSIHWHWTVLRAVQACIWFNTSCSWHTGETLFWNLSEREVIKIVVADGRNVFQLKFGVFSLEKCVQIVRYHFLSWPDTRHYHIKVVSVRKCDLHQTATHQTWRVILYLKSKPHVPLKNLYILYRSKL